MQKANQKDVVVLIPIYKEKLSKEELISLKQLNRHLAKFDKFFVAPDRLVKGAVNRKGFKVIRFDGSFFTSRNGYNKLLLQEGFYKAFSKYKYMLIYQLDALVFSNQLNHWANKNYDYVASPWFRSLIASLSNKEGSPISGGNGGFSLRNIPKSIEVLKKVQFLTKRRTTNSIVGKLWFLEAVFTGKSHKIWLDAPADNYPFNEDGFWSLEAPKYLPGFKVAPFKEAVKFAFEKFPRKCFELNKGNLPFGCHAWERYDKDFWLPYLKD